LQSYANNKYATIPRQISILEKLKGQLTIECDELWSFVFSKINKVDIWLAINRKTREIVDFYGGDRTAKSA
jgi:insertion element IS1 protein InsB